MYLFVGILLNLIGIVSIIIMSISDYKEAREETIKSHEHVIFILLDHLFGRSSLSVFLATLLSFIAILLGIGFITTSFDIGATKLSLFFY